MSGDFNYQVSSHRRTTVPPRLTLAPSLIRGPRCPPRPSRSACWSSTTTSTWPRPSPRAWSGAGTPAPSPPPARPGPRSSSRTPFDVVLTDLRMADLGRAGDRRASARERPAGRRGVRHHRVRRREDGRRGDEARGVALPQKPIDLAELRAVVDKSAERRPHASATSAGSSTRSSASRASSATARRCSACCNC